MPRPTIHVSNISLNRLNKIVLTSYPGEDAAAIRIGSDGTVNASADAGDGLLDLIVSELASTYTESHSDLEKLENARDVIRRLRRDVEAVEDALLAALLSTR